MGTWETRPTRETLASDKGAQVDTSVTSHLGWQIICLQVECDELRTASPWDERVHVGRVCASSPRVGSQHPLFRAPLHPQKRIILGGLRHGYVKGH